MKKLFLLGLIAIIGLLSIPTTQVLAQVPRLLNFSGNLWDNTQNPPVPYQSTGEPIVVEIFDQATGGVAIWSDQFQVDVENGYFSVNLGSGTEPLDLEFDKPYYVQVKIGNNGTPSERVPLTSSAYALNAQTSAFALEVADGSVTQDKLAPGVQALPIGPAGGDLIGSYPNPEINPDKILESIEPGSITQDKLAPNVTTPPSGPASGDLTGSYPDPLIAPGAVRTDRIADGAVTSQKIASRTILNQNIVENQIDNFLIDNTDDFTFNSVTTTDGTTVNGDLLVNGTSTLIGASTFTNVVTANNGVTITNGLTSDTGMITSATVTTLEGDNVMYASGTITDVEGNNLSYSNGTFTNNLNVSGTITGTLANNLTQGDGIIPFTYNNGAAATVGIANSGVTNAKIADDAVTEPKIGASNAAINGFVLGYNGTNLEWVPGSVETTGLITGDGTTGDEIRLDNTQGLSNEVIIKNAAGDSWTTSTINGGVIDDGSITTDDIANGTIVNEDIGNTQITSSKLSSNGQGAGQVLVSDGAGNVTWINGPLALDYAGTYNGTNDAFSITHNGSAGKVMNLSKTDNANTSPVLDLNGHNLLLEADGASDPAEYKAKIINSSVNGRALLLEGNSVNSTGSLDPADIDNAVLVVRNNSGGNAGYPTANASGKTAIKTYGDIWANSAIGASSLIAVSEIIIGSGSNTVSITPPANLGDPLNFNDDVEIGSLTNSADLDVWGDIWAQGLVTGASMSFTSATFDNINITNNLTVGGTTSLSNLTAAASTVSTLNATGATTLGSTLNVTGNTTLSNLTATAATLTTADINGGTIDGASINGTTIGGTTAAAASFSDVNISGDLNFDNGQKVNEIVTTITGTSTDSQLPTAEATWELVQSITANNGLTNNSGTMQLGGNLIKSTTITTNQAGDLDLILNGTGEVAFYNGEGVYVDGILNVGNATNGGNPANVLFDGGTVNFTNAEISQTGNTKQVSFEGNVDASNGLDVTGANLTVGGAAFIVNQTNGNISSTGNLIINGNSTLGDDATADQVIVNASMDIKNSITNTSSNNGGRVNISDADGLSVIGSYFSTNGNIELTNGNITLTNGAITTSDGNVTVGGTGNLNVTGTGGIQNSSGIQPVLISDTDGLDVRGNITNGSGNALTLTDANGINLSGGNVTVSANQTVNGTFGFDAGANVDEILTSVRATGTASNDKLVTEKAVRDAIIAIPSANGITNNSGTIELGGSLNKATTITNNGENLTIAGATNSTVFSSTGDVDFDGHVNLDRVTVNTNDGSFEITGANRVTATSSNAAANAIDLDATAGGIEISAAGTTNLSSSSAGVNAVTINASAGGVDLDAAGVVDIDAGTRVDIENLSINSNTITSTTDVQIGDNTTITGTLAVTGNLTGAAATFSTVSISGGNLTGMTNIASTNGTFTNLNNTTIGNTAAAAASFTTVNLTGNLTGAAATFSTLSATGAASFASTATFTGATNFNGAVTLGDNVDDVVTLTGSLAGANPIVLEGTTADAFETTISVIDPTADRTLYIPNNSGTFLTTGNVTVNNGLSYTSNSFQLGGNLTTATNVINNGNALVFRGNDGSNDINNTFGSNGEVTLPRRLEIGGSVVTDADNLLTVTTNKSTHTGSLIKLTDQLNTSSSSEYALSAVDIRRAYGIDFKTYSPTTIGVANESHVFTTDLRHANDITMKFLAETWNPTNGAPDGNNSIGTVIDIEAVNATSQFTAIKVQHGRLIWSNNSYTPANNAAVDLSNDGEYSVIFVTTDGTNTVTMPSNAVAGQIIYIFNKGAGTLDGIPDGGDITTNTGRAFIYDGTNWLAIL